MPDVVIGVAVFVVEIEVVLRDGAGRSVGNAALIERVGPAVLRVKRKAVAETFAKGELQRLIVRVGSVKEVINRARISGYP